MEVDVVVKRYKETQPCGPQPSDSVSTHRQQYKSHVELQGLGSSFSREKTITHYMECFFLSILKEFPNEKTNHDGDPQSNNPNSLPILLQIVDEIGAESTNWAFLSQSLEVLAQSLASVAESLAVVQVRILLQQQGLQLPQLIHNNKSKYHKNKYHQRLSMIFNRMYHLIIRSRLMNNMLFTPVYTCVSEN